MTLTSSQIWEGINGIAQVSMAIAVGAGVYIANKQLKSWRLEHQSKRKADVAEKLLSNAMDAKDALSSVRSAMEGVPQDVEDRQAYIVRLKGERMMGYAEVFERLRASQVQFRALVGDMDVNSAVEDILEVRREVLVALQMLVIPVAGGRQTNEGFAFEEEMRSKIYAMGSDKYDKLAPRIRGAIETLETKLLPAIRMEGS